MPAVFFVILAALVYSINAQAKGGQNDHCPCADAALEPPLSKSVNMTDTHGPILCIFFDPKLFPDKDFALVSEAVEILTNANETMPLHVHILEDIEPFLSSLRNPSKSILGAAGATCHVLAHVVPSAQYEATRARRELCPGKCFPTPEMQVPISWLLTPTVSPQLLRNANKAIIGGVAMKDDRTSQNALRGEDAYLTCSLGLQQYLHSGHHGAPERVASATTQISAPTSVTYLLMTLFWRRLMECRERKLWRQAYMEFTGHLEEYFAVEQQFSTHRARMLADNLASHDRESRSQHEGQTLGQWEDQLKRHRATTGKAPRKISKGQGQGQGQGRGQGQSQGGITAGSKSEGAFSTRSAARRHKNRNTGGNATSSNNNIIAGRRRVEALVIWIGSEKTLPLMLDQSRMLAGQTFVGHNAVVGWAADDRLYGCTDEATHCAAGAAGNRRFKYLPNTAINQMPIGWGCAQRRPLRVLAHTLQLYDPSFVVIVDDDTFVNFPMLVQRLGRYIAEDMTKSPIVLGEFMGREGPAGHLSRKGLFAGGSGYILGRALLSQLTAAEVWALGGLGLVKGPTPQSLSRGHKFDGDAYRSIEQMEKLSVLADAVQQSAGNCPTAGGATAASKTLDFGVSNTGDTCVVSLLPRHRNTGPRNPGQEQGHGQSGEVLGKSAQDGKSVNFNEWHWPSSSLLKPSLSTKADFSFDSMVVPIGTSLIDMCAGLMSNEETCQHSDHAMGRCLLYGASGVPVGAVCQTQVPLESVPSVNPITGETIVIGMCFMTPECNLESMITCHRYKPADDSAYTNAKKKRAAAAALGEMDILEKGKELAFFLAGKPSRLLPKQSYYKAYSSFWNGTHTDTNYLT